MFGISRKTKLKPGLICVPASEQGRYNQFNFCMAQLRKPKGSIADWRIGENKALFINLCFKRAIEEKFDWVWVLDETCAFDPFLLTRLLKNFKPVVFPFILDRIPPYRPTLKQPKDDSYLQFGMEHFKDKSGLIDITGLCADVSGMLIKTSVLKKIKEPWVENEHNVALDYGLNFCKKLNDLGIEFCLDLDNHMGHMTHIQICPHKLEDGKWISAYQSFDKRLYEENTN